jgi:hypothetical protein
MADTFLQMKSAGPTTYRAIAPKRTLKQRHELKRTGA